MKLDLDRDCGGLRGTRGGDGGDRRVLPIGPRECDRDRTPARFGSQLHLITIAPRRFRRSLSEQSF